MIEDPDEEARGKLIFDTEFCIYCQKENGDFLVDFPDHVEPIKAHSYCLESSLSDLGFFACPECNISLQLLYDNKQCNEITTKSYAGILPLFPPEATRFFLANRISIYYSLFSFATTLLTICLRVFGCQNLGLTSKIFLTAQLICFTTVVAQGLQFDKYFYIH